MFWLRLFLIIWQCFHSCILYNQSITQLQVKGGWYSLHYCLCGLVVSIVREKREGTFSCSSIWHTKRFKDHEKRQFILFCLIFFRLGVLFIIKELDVWNLPDDLISHLLSRSNSKCFKKLPYKFFYTGYRLSFCSMLYRPQSSTYY